MNITTDNIVSDYIANVCPLKGALYCDYVTQANFKLSYLEESFNNPLFMEDHRPPLNLDMARGNFWRLVRKYACPTRYEIGVWVKCLLRHCYALAATAVAGKGPNAGKTLLPLTILDDPNHVIDMMNVLGDILQNKLSKEMDGADYKDLLENVDKGNAKTYVPVIQMLASFCWGEDDEEGKQNVDLNDCRGVNDESILTLLYNHITECVGSLKRWHNSATAFNGAEFQSNARYCLLYTSDAADE